MEYLAQFIDNQNRQNAIFGGEQMDLSKLDDALAQKLFGMLEGELSPENLCCDGELPHAQVKVKATLLNGAVRDLEKLGYTQDPPSY